MATITARLRADSTIAAEREFTANDAGQILTDVERWVRRKAPELAGSEEWRVELKDETGETRTIPLPAGSADHADG